MMGMISLWRGAAVFTVSKRSAHGFIPTNSTSEVDPVDPLQSQRDPRSRTSEDFTQHKGREDNEHHHGANKMAPPEVRSDSTIGMAVQSAILLRLHASDIAMYDVFAVLLVSSVASYEVSSFFRAAYRKTRDCRGRIS
jgi:hypothetical protein